VPCGSFQVSQENLILEAAVILDQIIRFLVKRSNLSDVTLLILRCTNLILPRRETLSFHFRGVGYMGIV
jgi:hypothetical protein